jgi:hypothetical protein
MSYKLYISEWVMNVRKEHRKAASQILARAAELKNRSSYSDYLPLDYSNPQNQKFVGEVLGDIWGACHEEGIPPLNFLVGRGDMNFLPSPNKGVGKWYQGMFNTLRGFDKYCQINAELAELALKEGLVTIHP